MGIVNFKICFTRKFVGFKKELKQTSFKIVCTIKVHHKKTGTIFQNIMLAAISGGYFQVFLKMVQ